MGNHNVSVRAFDGASWSDFGYYDIGYYNEAPSIPVLSAESNSSNGGITLGSKVTINAIAEDPDFDPI